MPLFVDGSEQGELSADQWTELTVAGVSAAGPCRCLRFVFQAGEGSLHILQSVKRLPLVKFLKGKGWGLATSLADSAMLIGLVVHYTDSNTLSVELDPGQACNHPSLLALLPVLTAALNKPSWAAAAAGPLRVLDQSEQLHGVSCRAFCLLWGGSYTALSARAR